MLGHKFLKNQEAGAPPVVQGGLWTWGGSSQGEGARGTTTAISSPVQVGSLTDWSDVSTATFVFGGVRSNGTLWGAGINEAGELGLGNTTPHSSPVQVGSLTNWSQVSVTRTRMAAVKTDGTLWCWGSNDFGYLGNGLSDESQTGAQNKSSPVQVGSLTDWARVSIGVSTVVAVKTDGTLWTWGNNTQGQLGQGNSGAGTHRSSPVQVGSLTDWSKAYAGSQFVVAIKTDGTLWAWGFGSGGVLGQSDSTSRSSPVQIGSLTDWADVDVDTSVLAVKTDGTLWSWGNNTRGQLGRSDLTPRSSPVQVGSLTDWSKPSQSSNSAFCIKTDGTLWAWGEATSGQLGNSNTTRRSSPVQVGSDTNWLKISGDSNAGGIRSV